MTPEERLQQLQRSGWELTRDHRLIRERYHHDLDFADSVPRELMYFDIGILCGIIEKLERNETMLQAVQIAIKEDAAAHDCGEWVVGFRCAACGRWVGHP